MTAVPGEEVAALPLVDRFGRVHRSLRISVTDRCNIRCFYCMPDVNVAFRPREELLTFEEIAAVAAALAPAGIAKIRLTGGEPLVRRGLDRLVARLAALPGVADVALTTNGLLLAEQAAALKAAGLTRLNVSLDALTEATFRRIARRDGLARVLEGLAEAKRVGFAGIRLNAVALAGLTEAEAVPLAEFARREGFTLRFIEFMPLDAEQTWRRGGVLTGETLRAILAAAVGPLVPVERPDPAQPATDYAWADGGGRVGFIDPVSRPFCGACDRLRLTAEGALRNCLFSGDEWDLRAILRSGGDAADVRAAVRDALAAKQPGHGIDDPSFLRPARAMYQIGG